MNRQDTREAGRKMKSVTLDAMTGQRTKDLSPAARLMVSKNRSGGFTVPPMPSGALVKPKMKPGVLAVRLALWLNYGHRPGLRHAS